MTFHRDFWTVVGTAAPIIVLATVVAASESLDAVRDLWRRRKQLLKMQAFTPTLRADLRRADRLITLGYVAAAVNLGLQTALLLTSLLSLSWGRDAAGTRAVVSAEAASIFLVAAVGVIKAFARKAVIRFEDDAAEQLGGAAAAKLGEQQLAGTVADDVNGDVG